MHFAIWLIKISNMVHQIIHNILEGAALIWRETYSRLFPCNHQKSYDFLMIPGGIEYNSLKNTLKAFDDFKNKQKSLWANLFWYVKEFIFWKCIQYTMHWDKTQMLRKIPSGKISGTKNSTFFRLQAPSYHSFTFNFRFLYELKYKVRLSRTVCGIFHFRFRFVFIKVYIFIQQNAWILWLKNVIIPFKIKIIEKPHKVLLPDLWFLSCNKKFENSMISAWVEALLF